MNRQLIAGDSSSVSSVKSPSRVVSEMRLMNFCLSQTRQIDQPMHPHPVNDTVFRDKTGNRCQAGATEGDGAHRLPADAQPSHPALQYTR